MGEDSIFRNLSRRDALRAGLSAALAGFLPASFAAATMQKRVIPSSGEGLPVIGLGTSRVFDVGESESERAAWRAVLEALLEGGASLVDSSPMYRRAEAVSGVLAADLKATDRIFWATKVWADGREKGLDQISESFRLFGVERIDLMQVHNLRDWRVHMDTLRDLKQEGRIRYIGITHSRTEAFAQVEDVINQTELDFVQINYSLGEQQAAERILPLCADKGIATLINRPFMRGELFRKVAGSSPPDWAREFGAETWGRFLLKFILASPSVTCVIPASRDPAHMLDNLAAGSGPLPTPAQQRAMIEYFSAL